MKHDGFHIDSFHLPDTQVLLLHTHTHCLIFVRIPTFASAAVFSAAVLAAAAALACCCCPRRSTAACTQLHIFVFFTRVSRPPRTYARKRHKSTHLIGVFLNSRCILRARVSRGVLECLSVHTHTHTHTHTYTNIHQIQHVPQQNLFTFFMFCSKASCLRHSSSSPILLPQLRPC